jgi:hypothetical protein
MVRTVLLGCSPTCIHGSVVRPLLTYRSSHGERVSVVEPKAEHRARARLARGAKHHHGLLRGDGGSEARHGGCQRVVGVRLHARHPHPGRRLRPCRSPQPSRARSHRRLRSHRRRRRADRGRRRRRLEVRRELRQERVAVKPQLAVAEEAEHAFHALGAHVGAPLVDDVAGHRGAPRRGGRVGVRLGLARPLRAKDHLVTRE